MLWRKAGHAWAAWALMHSAEPGIAADRNAEEDACMPQCSYQWLGSISQA